MTNQTAASFRRVVMCVVGLGICGACTPPANDEDVPTRAYFPALEAARVPPPDTAPKDTCWARDATPAVIETVTDQVIEQPAILNDDGSLLAPAIYATETRQEIVVPRREYVFETICADQITPELISSLQRALAARGLYDGPISGQINRRTETALRSYQKPQEVETGLLTIQTARELGLVAVKRPA